MRVSGTTPAPTRYSALVAQPHSGWMKSSASGSSATARLEVGAVDAGVHVALAEPDVHVLAAELALHVGAEELVGAEQHLGVVGDRGDDVDGVRRRAADVGLGLHGGGRVDVADDDGAGVLGLPRPQLVGGDRLGEAAAGPLVGDQHRLVVAEDLRRLGHEVDAAEHDRRRLGLGGDPGQARASPRRGGRSPGSRAAGSCGRGSRRRAGGPARAPARPSRRAAARRRSSPAPGTSRWSPPQRTVRPPPHHPSVCRHPSAWCGAPMHVALGRRHTLGWGGGQGAGRRAASWRRSLVALTEPSAPIGWANTLTRSSSSRQPSSTTSGATGPRPARRSSATYSSSSGSDLVHPAEVAPDVVGQPVEAVLDPAEVAADVVEAIGAGGDDEPRPHEPLEVGGDVVGGPRCTAGAASVASRSRTTLRRGEHVAGPGHRAGGDARRLPSRRPAAARRTPRRPTAAAFAARSTRSTAANAQSATSSSRSMPLRAMARRPGCPSPLSTSRVDGPAVSSSRRRTPAVHHPPLEVGVRQHAQRDARVVVEQRRVPGGGDAAAAGLDDLGERADVPRHHAAPLVDRRRRGDRGARRRPPSAARIAPRSSSASRTVPSASVTTTFIRRWARHDRASSNIAGRTATPVDLAERDGQRVDERDRAAGRARRARLRSSRPSGSAGAARPWAASARGRRRARPGGRGSASRSPRRSTRFSAVSGTCTDTPSSGPPGS